MTGGADSTVRYWKVANDTHMLFNVHKKEGGSGEYVVDAIAMTNDATRVLAIGGVRHTLLLLGYGSVDAVSLLDPEHILAGGQDGGLTLWATNSRRPVASVEAAHGAKQLLSRTG